MSRRLVVLIAALLAVVAGIVTWRSIQPESALADAVSMAPAEAQRVTWTDWTGVRRELGADLDAGSSADDVQSFLDEAFSRDLSSMSALGSSATALQEEFGFSPATLQWELFAQSADGAVDLMRVDDDLSLAEVGDRLEALGWERPDDDDGVWVGGPDVLAGVGGSLTPELQHFALLADEHLVLASDQAPYLADAVAVVRGDEDGADELGGLTSGLGDAVAAAIFDGAYACEKLAMSQADDDAQAEAEQLVAAAGGVHPLTGFAMARLDGGNVRVVMQVEDADDAAADAEARAMLAAGPSPGQGGSFPDRFSVLEAGSRGHEITVDLQPAKGAYVLSDLTSGPVLFATC